MQLKIPNAKLSFRRKENGKQVGQFYKNSLKMRVNGGIWLFKGIFTYYQYHSKETREQYCNQQCA